MINFLKALITRLFRDRLGERAKKFCGHLQAIGVDAKIISHWSSHGNQATREIRIAITGKPVQQIVIREVTYPHVDNTDIVVYIDYLVKDSRIAVERYPVVIYTVRVRTFPLFGKVVDLRWEGDDCGTGLIDQLQGNMSIKLAIMKGRDIRISAGDGAWYIWPYNSPSAFFIPSEEEWNCYQAIARHLLDMKV